MLPPSLSQSKKKLIEISAVENYFHKTCETATKITGAEEQAELLKRQWIDGGGREADIGLGKRWWEVVQVVVEGVRNIVKIIVDSATTERGCIFLFLVANCF